MTPIDFEKMCASWLAEKAPSPEGFAAIVRASRDVLERFQRDLATEFEVAEWTVSCWAKGTARPHPLIQTQVIKNLQQRAGAVNQ